MTPADRLAQFPPDAAIIHELGHTLIGLEVGVQEDSIEFPMKVVDEVARAWCKEGFASAGQMIERGLAGMYFQSLLTPDSLDAGFVASVLDGSVFHVACLGDLAALMASQGCKGD
jgi:hypothetical protein